MSEHDYTAWASNQAANMRVCLVCKKPITELKKASYLEAGAGLRLVAHDTCLAALEEAKEEQEKRAILSEAANAFGRNVARAISKRLLD